MNRLAILLSLLLLAFAHPASAQILNCSDKDPRDELGHKAWWRVNACKARECHSNPGALIGLTAAKVEARCGDTNYRAARTVTATRTTEVWTYKMSPYGVGVLAVHFEGGIVVSASSY